MLEDNLNVYRIYIMGLIYITKEVIFVREFGKFLGWVGVVGYGIALFGFFCKYINKKYINKLPKDKKQLVLYYRFIMKYVLKFHKVAGIGASVAIGVHFYLMYNNYGLSIPGLFAAVVMWLVFILGIYGFAINKNLRGSWVKPHRVLAFVLVLLIIFHVLFKRSFMLY